jgi:hypothetical protein
MAGLWYITNDVQKWQQVMGKQMELDSLHGITYNQNEVRHTSTGSSTETVTNIVT